MATTKDVGKMTGEEIIHRLVLALIPPVSDDDSQAVDACKGELLSRLRMEWVSVKQELPAIGSTVIFCVDSEEDSQEIASVVRRNYLGAKNNADYEDISNRGYTHWKKLEPQPIKLRSGHA